MLERRPVNASLKLHVTARPANYSRAREWEKFLSLSPWALDVYKRGSRYAGVLYNVQANFHCNTRFCYANRDACREGASCTMFGIPVFLNWIEKDGQCRTLTGLVLIQYSVHFNPFFYNLIRCDNCCSLDLSFGYSLIRKDRFIKNLFPFLSDFEIENCDWNLREKISVLCSRFKRYCKTFIHISPRLFFIWNVNRINVIKVTFFLKDTRKSIKYAGPLSTLRTEFKNWYLNVTKIVVEGKKRYLLVDVVQFNRRQRQHFDCWVNGQRGKERGKMEWNAYENIGPFRSIDGPMVENGTNRLI